MLLNVLQASARLGHRLICSQKWVDDYLHCGSAWKPPVPSVVLGAARTMRAPCLKELTVALGGRSLTGLTSCGSDFCHEIKEVGLDGELKKAS